MVRNRFWNTTRGQVRALQTFTAAGSTKSSCAVITALRRPVCFIIRMIRSDGEKPILEYHSWSGPSAANVYGRGIDEILMRSDYSVTPTRVLYYQDDHEGSVTHLTDSSGAVIESYKYDAFGKPTINGGALTASAFGNRFMFTGREYVSQFGIYEYRNRAYHPGLGRFMSEDPKGFAAGDNNFFRYCANDPIDHTDALGLSQDSVLLTANQQNLEHGQGANQWSASQQNAQNQLRFTTYAPTATSVDKSHGNSAYSLGGGRTLHVENSRWGQGGSLSVGQVTGGPKPASAAVFGNGARIEREMGTKRDYSYINKDGVKVYQVDIVWTLKVFNKGGSKAANIPVSETISPPREAVGFSQHVGTNNSRTNSEGMATDFWGFGFSRPDGQVTDTQTISTPLGTAQWDQTVHANGDFEGPFTAFFH